jgi:hypothetical protein
MPNGSAYEKVPSSQMLGAASAVQLARTPAREESMKQSLLRGISVCNSSIVLDITRNRRCFDQWRFRVG